MQSLLRNISFLCCPVLCLHCAGPTRLCPRPGLPPPWQAVALWRLCQKDQKKNERRSGVETGATLCVVVCLLAVQFAGPPWEMDPPTLTAAYEYAQQLPDTERSSFFLNLFRHCLEVPAEGILPPNTRVRMERVRASLVL